MIAKKERMKNRQGWKMAVSCLVLCLFTLTPAYAASETVARAQEQWVYATEEGIKKESDTGGVQTTWASDEEKVTEILLAPEISLQLLDGESVLEIAPKTRYLLGFVNLKNGDAVGLHVSCTDRTATMRVGIKNAEGEMVYSEGEWLLSETFEIESDGKYSPFIQNMSNKTIEVTVEVFYSYK